MKLNAFIIRKRYEKDRLIQEITKKQIMRMRQARNQLDNGYFGDDQFTFTNDEESGVNTHGASPKPSVSHIISETESRLYSNKGFLDNESPEALLNSGRVKPKRSMGGTVGQQFGTEQKPERRSAYD